MNLIWWTTNDEAVQANTNTTTKSLPRYLRSSIQRRLVSYRRGKVDYGKVLVDQEYFGLISVPAVYNPQQINPIIISQGRVGILIDQADAELMMAHYPGRWTNHQGIEFVDDGDAAPPETQVTPPDYLTHTSTTAKIAVRDDDLRWVLGRLRRLKLKPEEETRVFRLGGALEQMTNGLLIVKTKNPLQTISALSTCMTCTPHDAKVIIDNIPVRIGANETAETLQGWHIALEQAGAEVRFGA